MATNQASRNHKRPERVRTAFLPGNSFRSISVFVLLMSYICLRSANGVLNRALSSGEGLELASGPVGCATPFTAPIVPPGKQGFKDESPLVTAASTDRKRASRAVCADRRPGQTRQGRRLPEVCKVCRPLEPSMAPWASRPDSGASCASEESGKTREIPPARAARVAASKVELPKFLAVGFPRSPSRAGARGRRCRRDECNGLR